MEVNEAANGDRSDVESASSSIDVQAASGIRRRWALTQEAFDSLLAALNEERNKAGEIYIEIRSNLIRFFEWRGCPFPEDHADETFNRVAKRVVEGEEIRNPSSYCVGVARMLLLEINKERAREQLALGEIARSDSVYSPDTDTETRIECLRSCLRDLPTDNRELIVGYYQGEKSAKIQNRKQLSERLKIPGNTLRMRALRLRERLQDCVENCARSPAQ
jgi:DNA-directed RNA polymerase specialized sigma24 family protein